jgi:hypothetical protein
MPLSIAQVSASVPSSHDLSLAAFTINTAESNFRHTQGDRFFGDGAVPFRRLLERLQRCRKKLQAAQYHCANRNDATSTTPIRAIPVSGPLGN